MPPTIAPLPSRALPAPAGPIAGDGATTAPTPEAAKLTGNGTGTEPAGPPSCGDGSGTGPPVASGSDAGVRLPGRVGVLLPESAAALTVRAQTEATATATSPSGISAGGTASVSNKAREKLMRKPCGDLGVLDGLRG